MNVTERKFQLHRLRIKIINLASVICANLSNLWIKCFLNPSHINYLNR